MGSGDRAPRDTGRWVNGGFMLHGSVIGGSERTLYLSCAQAGRAGTAETARPPFDRRRVTGSWPPVVSCSRTMRARTRDLRRDRPVRGLRRLTTIDAQSL